MAAFRRQKVHGFQHHWIVNSVENLASAFVLNHKVGINQSRQVVSQCRWGQPKMLGDASNSKAIIASFHKEAKNRQSGIVAKCRKGAGVGACCCHEAINNHKTGFVNLY